MPKSTILYDVRRQLNPPPPPLLPYADNTTPANITSACSVPPYCHAIMPSMDHLCIAVPDRFIENFENFLLEPSHVL